MPAEFAKNSLLIVLGLVIVAAGFITVFNLTSQNPGVFTLQFASCTTTDSGYNLSKAGSCTDANGTRSETCAGSQLVENYCVNNRCASTQVSCPLGGVCTGIDGGGACVPISACADSDNGSNTSVAGTCSDYNGAHADYCIDSTRVAEYVCGGYACVKGNGIPCPTGTSCVNGACTSQQFLESSWTTTANLNSASGTPHEFVRTLSSSEIPFLMNIPRSYVYNGITQPSILMKEKIVIDVDAKFDKTFPIKDLGAYIGTGGYKHVFEFGDGNKNGIPAVESLTNNSQFVDNDNDNITIPLFGKTFLVDGINRKSSPAMVRLVKESARKIYYEGNEITGLGGRGAYAGQSMKITVLSIASSGNYSAGFELYDQNGTLIQTLATGEGANLEELFMYQGNYLLGTHVRVTSIAAEISTNRGIVFFQGNGEKYYHYEGQEIQNLDGTGAYAGQKLKIKIASITASGQPDTIMAAFDLIDSQGNRVDMLTTNGNEFLNDLFMPNGQYALGSDVFIKEITSESNTGIVYAYLGQDVVRLFDNKIYSSKSYSQDANYWIAELDFNSVPSTSPAVDTLQRITIKNNVQRWDNNTGRNPLFAGTQSLVPSHQSPALQTANFLQNAHAQTIGFGFSRIKFEGFDFTPGSMANIQIGKTDNCAGNGYGTSTGCIKYKDAGNVVRGVPFYLELPLNAASWSTFSISSATFWYRCNTADAVIYLRSDQNNQYLNGARLSWSTDGNWSYIMTDLGWVVVGPFVIGTPVYIGGVEYIVQDTAGQFPAFLTLRADGNCQFSSTDPNISPTYVGMGEGLPLNNTIYYSDDYGARTGRASYPLNFTAHNLTDTYRYGLAANEEYNKMFLLLDRTTNFSSAYSNFKVSLVGTDLVESGAVAISPADNQTQVAARGKNRTHYLPHHPALGASSFSDTQYYIAQFAVDANGGNKADALVNIDTGTGKPVAFPNNNLSSWSVDVNAGNLWTLTTSTLSQVYLQHAYLDYGSRFDLDSNRVSITGPINQANVKLTVYATIPLPFAQVCGNNIVEGTEQCDGTAAPSCSSGYICQSCKCVSDQTGTVTVTPDTGLTTIGSEGGPFYPASQAYTLTNTGATSISWTAAKTQSWITLSKTSGTLAGGASDTVTVSINTTAANALEAGNYSDTLTIAAAGQSNITRAISLMISSTTPKLIVSPATGIISSGNSGGPFSPTSQAYTLINSSGSVIGWTAAKTQNWTTVSSTSGSLNAGADTTVTVSINAQANALAAGNYSDTITFTNTSTGQGNTTRAVSLAVAAAQSCSNGICSAGENCPADASSCPELAVCITATCANGCGAQFISSGQHDTSGSKLCTGTTGCYGDGWPGRNCACNGSGACVECINDSGCSIGAVCSSSGICAPID
ncbi:MAG TPA: hypothetical protein VI977_03885 [archaeon]|nr:hypothetical protein [archaeon]